jgi:hypothetical protein
VSDWIGSLPIDCTWPGAPDPQAAESSLWKDKLLVAKAAHWLIGELALPAINGRW